MLPSCFLSPALPCQGRSLLFSALACTTQCMHKSEGKFPACLLERWSYKVRNFVTRRLPELTGASDEAYCGLWVTAGSEHTPPPPHPHLLPSYKPTETQISAHVVLCFVPTVPTALSNMRCNMFDQNSTLTLLSRVSFTLPQHRICIVAS